MANGLAFGEGLHLRVVDGRGRTLVTWIAAGLAVVIVGIALALSVRSIVKPHAAVSAVASAWHPEPAFLLQHSSELQLNADQVRHAQVAARVWNLQKAAFEERFKTVGKDSGQALRDLQSAKPLTGTYGQIVNDFEKARANAWSDASSRLTGDQALIVEDIRQGKAIDALAPQPPAVQVPGDTDSKPDIKNLDSAIRAIQSRLSRECRRRHPNAARIDDLQQKLAYLKSRKAAQDNFVAEITAEPRSSSPLQYIPITPLTLPAQPIPLAKSQPPAVPIHRNARIKK